MTSEAYEGFKRCEKISKGITWIPTYSVWTAHSSNEHLEGVKRFIVQRLIQKWQQYADEFYCQYCDQRYIKF